MRQTRLTRAMIGGASALGIGQELAFFSWFYHQSPSLGVNGWYSNKGTFKTFAAPC